MNLVAKRDISKVSEVDTHRIVENVGELSALPCNPDLTCPQAGQKLGAIPPLAKRIAGTQPEKCVRIAAGNNGFAREFPDNFSNQSVLPCSDAPVKPLKDVEGFDHLFNKP